MKLLHIDSSILGENSVSRTVTAAAVDQLAKAHPGIDVVYRDLAADPLPRWATRPMWTSSSAPTSW
jgi:FMN-dependent NADH-azoreductase